MTATRPMFRPTQRRSELLATTTLREFSGGWNVADEDLNLDARFAKIFQNMFRARDGSTAVRWGTRLFADMTNQSATTGSLGNNPLSVTNASAVVTVTHTAHGKIAGQTIAYAGLTATGGIPAGELNATHTINEIVDADTLRVVVTTTATSTTTGGGSGGTFSHNNKIISGDIINMVYFQDRLVGVSSSGQVLTVDVNGVCNIVFNTSIANKQTGSPAGWSATSFVSFATFGGQLIICNGVDKPLIVDFSVAANVFPVSYLQDLGTGSNANTPIGRYVLAMDHYVLIAGDPVNPGRVHISNFDTSGTWSGDPNPNDGTNVDLDKVITSDNTTVRGLLRHRDNVAVAFDDNIVIGELGIFDASNNHTPDFSDVVSETGAVSHRSMAQLGTNLISVDLAGMASIRRTQFTNQLQMERISELIDSELEDDLLGLSIGSAEDRVFGVYNTQEKQYLLFVPNNDLISGTTETLCYAYTTIPALKIKMWSLYKGWNFSCAARSALRRVFFGQDDKIYILGSDRDPVHADYVNDYDTYTWAQRSAYTVGQRVRDTDGKVYEVLIDHYTPTSGTFTTYRAGAGASFYQLYEGEDISFVWELPWADFDRRMNNKQSRYIHFDTRGEAEFIASMFVDNKYIGKPPSTSGAEEGTGGSGFTAGTAASATTNPVGGGFQALPTAAAQVTDPETTLLPTLSMKFVAGDAAGFGATLKSQGFGGGRPTITEALYGWTTKFRIAKLRMEGATKKKLRFVSITLAYTDGSIRSG